MCIHNKPPRYQYDVSHFDISVYTISHHDIVVNNIILDYDIYKEMAQNNEIIVSLEHKNNYSVIIGLPYKIGLFKKTAFGDIFALEGKHDIF